MLTTQGEIVLELYAAKAPLTVANFLDYTKAGLYSNTLYHRVLVGFVNQGGGFTADGKHIATYAPIKLESNNGLSNERGTIAMARTSDPNSATSEFFINTANNSTGLDFGCSAAGCDPNGYAVFGKVIAGMDVVDKISGVAVNANGLPNQDVVTYWVQRLK